MGVLLPSLVLSSSLLVLAGCGGEEEPSGRTSASEAAEEATSGADGTLAGDPVTIRRFTDPAVEVVDEADLVAYALPGLTGDGADCVRDRVDVGVVLGNDVERGAAVLSDLVLSCVADREVGKVLAMYAVGFETDGPSRYSALSGCATEALADTDPAEVREALVRVYGERLELSGPPTSRAVAAEEIARLTDCSASATPTVEATSPSPEASGSPEPSEEGGGESRVIGWDRLQPGDCLVDLPRGRITDVTVVGCQTRHRIEVVGATFSAGSDDAETQCANLYTAFTGRRHDPARHVLDHLEAEPGTLSSRLICLASPADGRATTGSLR